MNFFTCTLLLVFVHYRRLDLGVNISSILDPECAITEPEGLMVRSADSRGIIRHLRRSKKRPWIRRMSRLKRERYQLDRGDPSSPAESS